MSQTADEYLVSFGKSGGFGRFAAQPGTSLRRGDRVVMRTARGIEVGAVLCAANDMHSRMLKSPLSGQLLRPLSGDDERQLSHVRALEQRIFERSSELTKSRSLPIAVVDVETPLGGEQAILHVLGEDASLGDFLETLSEEFGLPVRIEGLSQPQLDEEECDEPNCGKKNGGCDSCSTGGGCSACGAKNFDIRQYFGHLREQMEQKGRVAIL